MTILLGMHSRAMMLLLVFAIAAQACWAAGEWLHTHAPSDATVAATTPGGGLMESDCLHDHDDSSRTEHEDDHHHSCLAHSPFTLAAEATTATPTTETYRRPALVHPSHDAPLAEIDRPNWRTPA